MPPAVLEPYSTSSQTQPSWPTLLYDPLTWQDCMRTDGFVCRTYPLPAPSKGGTKACSGHPGGELTQSRQAVDCERSRHHLFPSSQLLVALAGLPGHLWGRVCHRGEKSFPQGHRAKWMGRCSRVLSTTGLFLRVGGHSPPTENLVSSGL